MFGASDVSEGARNSRTSTPVPSRNLRKSRVSLFGVGGNEQKGSLHHARAKTPWVSKEGISSLELTGAVRPSFALRQTMGTRGVRRTCPAMSRTVKFDVESSSSSSSEAEDWITECPKEPWTWSAVLERIKASGTISVHDLDDEFKKVLVGSHTFLGMSSLQIVVAWRKACRVVKGTGVFWHSPFFLRRFHLSDGHCETKPMLYFVLDGAVQVVCRNALACELVAGSLVDCTDQEMLGVLAIQGATVAAMAVDEVEQALRRAALATNALSQSALQLRGLVGASPEGQEARLAMVAELLGVMSFFEDHDSETLRQLAIFVHCVHVRKGEVIERAVPNVMGHQEVRMFGVLRGCVDECVQVQIDEGAVGKRKTTRHSARYSSRSTMRRGTRGLLQKVSVPPSVAAPEPGTASRSAWHKRQTYYEGSAINAGAMLDKTWQECDTRLIAHTDAELIVVTREQYERAVGNRQRMELQKIVHGLRSAPPTRPEERPRRTPEQLELLLAQSKEWKGVFADQSRECMMQILAAARLLDARKGHMVMQEGEIGDQFYAILDGKVAVHVAYGSQPQPQLSAARVPTPSSHGGALKPSGGQSSARGPPAELGAGAFGRQRSPAGDPKPESTGLLQALRFLSAQRELQAMGTKTAAGARGFPTAESRWQQAGHNQGHGAWEADSHAVAELQDDSDGSQPGADVDVSDEFAGETEEQTCRREQAESVLNQAMVPRVELEGRAGDVVQVLGKGAALGVQSLLHSEKRTASITTLEPTKFLVVAREDFLAVMEARLKADIKVRTDFLYKHLPGFTANLRQPSAKLFRLQGGAAAASGSPSSASGSNAGASLVERIVGVFFPVTLPRGNILCQQGNVSNTNLYLLRSGTVALLAPVAGPIMPGMAIPHWRFGTASVSALITTEGQLFGASSAILGKPEPTTSRVESTPSLFYSSCWLSLQKTLPTKVGEALREWSRALHERRGATDSSACRAQKAKSKFAAHRAHGDEATRSAWQDVFSAAACFGGEPSMQPAPDHQAPGALPDAAARPVASVSMEPEASSARQATYELEVHGALQRVERAASRPKDTKKQAAQEMEDMMHLAQFGTHRVVSAKKRPESRPPLDISAGRWRAELFQILEADGSERARSLAAKAMLDPDKADVGRWLERYISDPRLRHNSQLQQLRLLMRRCGRGLPPDAHEWMEEEYDEELSI